MREVERKFYFLPERWKGRPVKSSTLEQGYLDDTGTWEARLRRTPLEQRFTLKRGVGLERVEWEVQVTEAEFGALWPHTAARRLQKRRERHLWKGTSFDVDTYEGALAGLVVAECEFPDARTARQFSPPSAFGPELTYDPRFKNHQLAEGTSVPLVAPGGTTEGWSFGVLPFRQGRLGWELVLVSSRRHDRWIFPKGQPEPGLTFAKVALLEAREEAGLRGRIVAGPLVLPYAREGQVTNLLLYPMRVTGLAQHWLEEGQRERRVVPLDQADQYGELATWGAQWVLDQTRD